MFKIVYTYTTIITPETFTETFTNADDMRDWFEASGLEDLYERGELDEIHFYRVAVSPTTFWVEFTPAWLWTI